MSKLPLMMTFLLMALSRYSAYSIITCFEISSTSQYTYNNSPVRAHSIKAHEEVRATLHSKNAPIPNVISTKFYRNGNDECVVYLMNVFPISSLLHLMAPAITSAFNSLVDILDEIKQQFFFPLHLDSFMYEPSTNRIVYADILSMLTSYKPTTLDTNYKYSMKGKLAQLIKLVPSKPPKPDQDSFDYEIQRMIGLKKSANKLNFLDEGFEKLYAKANPNTRSRMRKVVQDLPAIDSSESPSTLTIEGTSDKIQSTLALKIDGQEAKTLHVRELNSFSNFFLCNYHRTLYKQCKFIGAIEQILKDQMTFSIPKGYKVDINIHSTKISSVKFGTEKRTNENRSSDIYIIVVPEDMQPIKASKVVVEQKTFSAGNKKLYFFVNHNNELVVKESNKDLPTGSSKSVGIMSKDFHFPDNLEFIQAPYHVFTDGYENYIEFEQDVYYLEIPKYHLLIYMTKDRPGLHLYDHALETSFKFYKVCSNPSENLRIGGKGKGKYDSITFQNKTVSFPRPVDFSWSNEKFICLAGDMANGFTYNLEKDSIVKFYWNFNEYKDYYSARPYDYIRLLFLEKSKNVELAAPFKTFKFPKFDVNSIFISIIKPYNREGFSVRVYFFKKTNDFFQIYEKTHASNLDEAIKAEEKIKEYGEKKDKAVEKLNKAKEKSMIIFESVPTNFLFLKNKEELVKSPLEDGDTVYLSANEIIYAFYPTLPTDCNPYFTKDYKDVSPIKSDTITINCIVRGHGLFSEGDQIHPNEDDSTLGIQRVIRQSSDDTFKPNWYFI